ncbi:MAG: SDR family oxidoreductase [Actinobacteria bacterium]|nr:SDR family oxidoreductase [Actinomycetota bacterium]
MSLIRFGYAVVTGGAGFIGSHLCDALVRAGTTVHCVDNFATGSAENVAHLVGHPRFRLYERDVTEFLSIDGPVDVVFSLACPASPADYFRLPIETMKAGSLGTGNALGLARAKRARFLLASTSETYGDPLVHPQTESYWGNVNPVGPRAVYDEAKRFAEALTTAYHEHRGVDTGIVRIFNTYGPRMRSGDGRAIPTFVCQALSGRPITVTGDGSQTRSVCYVDDTVRGLIAVASSSLNTPVNVGNPDEMTVLELADRVRQATGSAAPIEFVPAMADDPRLRRPDISLITRTLGWHPEVSWAEGIKRTVRWFECANASTGADASLGSAGRALAIEAGGFPLLHEQQRSVG